jgi:prefoldin subunit 5
MSTSIHQGAVKRLTKERADLEGDKADLLKKIASLTKDIGALRQGIARTTSESIRRSKQRQLESRGKEYACTQEKLAGVERKLSSKLGDLDRHLRALSRDQTKSQQRQEQTDKNRRREELRHARDVTRETEHQAQLQAQLRKSPLVIDLARLPTHITVLFLAANPIDQSSLRLDEEHRTIVGKLRASEYRDAVNLISRWAARPGDLQQELNEHQPHIVHFSGHGNQDEIVF